QKLRDFAQPGRTDVAGILRAAGVFRSRGAGLLSQGGDGAPRHQHRRRRHARDRRMSVSAGLIGLAVLVLLLALQVPVAIAMILAAFGGVWMLFGLAPAIGVLANTPYDFVASWTLSAVPMFLLMGFVAFHSGLTAGLFDAAKLVLRRVPGGLGIAAILACSGFASVC